MLYKTAKAWSPLMAVPACVTTRPLSFGTFPGLTAITLNHNHHYRHHQPPIIQQYHPNKTLINTIFPTPSIYLPILPILISINPRSSPS